MNAAVVAFLLASKGVTWKKGRGALCPVCGKKMRMGSKQGDVRYCYCKDPSCIVCVTGTGIKASAE